ncbi:MAG: hypothetical protein U0T81_09530 [Saprospiraceae bacterium]
MTTDSTSTPVKNSPFTEDFVATYRTCITSRCSKVEYNIFASYRKVEAINTTRSSGTDPLDTLVRSQHNGF